MTVLRGLTTRYGCAWWLTRAPVWAGMVTIAAASWVYLAHLRSDMSAMPGGNSVHQAMAAMTVTVSDQSVLAATFAMWAVMMMAMMLPSVAPSASLYMTLTRRRDPNRSTTMAAMYIAGYVAPWIAYAAPAALAQWALTRQMLLDPMAESTSALLSALILISAGAYQFLPMKNACLTRCRSPLGYFMTEWRDGRLGAFMLGVRYGSFCVGCCWALMAVMFVVGTMNLAWMALLSLVVLGEKLVPTHWYFDRVVGGLLITWGLISM